MRFDFTASFLRQADKGKQNKPKAKSKNFLTQNNTKTQKPYQPSLVNTNNTKVQKGKDEKGYLIGIMHLLPSDLSGLGNVCPYASPECRQMCLNTAGTWVNSDSVKGSRLYKTKLFFTDRPKFMDELRKSIEKLVRQAEKQGLLPAVRVNGTSDLPGVARTMAKEFPNVQFYDYTKVPMPWKRKMDNYHITFSRAENNEKEAMQALKHGVDVAVVFDVKKGKPLPETWKGYPVIDGDLHDMRFLDKLEGQGPFIIGLRAKGKARNKGGDECNSFVVKVDPLPQGAGQAKQVQASAKTMPHFAFYDDGGLFEAPRYDD